MNDTLPRHFSGVSAAFDLFCVREGLSVLGRGIDRYGSVEWTAVKNAEPWHRYITLALMQPMPEQPSFYDMETWFTVDDTARFVRTRAAHQTVDFGSSAIEAPDLVQEALSVAWNQATAVGSNDLREPVLVPIYNQTVQTMAEPGDDGPSFADQYPREAIALLSAAMELSPQRLQLAAALAHAVQHVSDADLVKLAGLLASSPNPAGEQIAGRRRSAVQATAEGPKRSR